MDLHRKKPKIAKDFGAEGANLRFLYTYFHQTSPHTFGTHNAFSLKFQWKHLFRHPMMRIHQKFSFQNLKIAKIFMISKFFHKISQNHTKSAKKTRVFFTKYPWIKQKNARSPLQNCHDFTDVIRRKTQGPDRVLFMLTPPDFFIFQFRLRHFSDLRRLFCAKNDQISGGSMQFLKWPCSAALKKADPIVDKLDPKFR